MTGTGYRELSLHGADNVRDLGGLPTGDGRRTRYGRLVRSASVLELTETDVRSLVEDRGLRLVVDLRLPEETGHGGGGLLAERVHRYANLPLRTADMVPTDAVPDAVGIDS